MTKGFRYSLAIPVLLAASIGCSKGVAIKTIPVRGKVTFKQAPLVGATVSFSSDTVGATAGMATNAASGVTQADGSYSLSTFVGSEVVEGVVAGKYKVTVSKRAAASGPGGGLEGLSPAELEKKMQGMSPEEMMKMGGAPPSAQGAAAAQSEIPERYSKPEESGLTSTVGPGGADPANFDLTE